ncbi:MAG: hypothetical protein RIR19_285 [Chloroflexota bacterium]|jgi:hypothetical protein
MDPLKFAALGVALIALGTFGTRRGGARSRAGRLLASLSPLTPSDALRLAARLGSGRYTAITGGVDAVEAFEDENHRPLVYRRERVLIDDGGAWREIDRAVRSVPFSISDATGAIAIDAAALDDGLIVVVRQWEGSVAELRDARRDFADASSRDLVGQLAASDPQRGARVALEQISTLDRATAAGRLADGRLTADGGRPLVFTTLERSEALRVIGTGRRASLLINVGGLLAVGAGLALLLLALLTLSAAVTSAHPAAATAATPTPTPVAPSGDARNGGVATGPGGALGLLIALALPVAFGTLVAAAALVIARVRRQSRDHARRD